MTDSKSKMDWVNPHQWIVNIACRIFYGAADRSMDELEVADMILEIVEAAELRGRIAGLREAAESAHEMANTIQGHEAKLFALWAKDCFSKANKLEKEIPL
jgi:hypothetical protein